MTIQMPEKKTGKSKKWTQQKFLMIGAGKIGKSEFWAQGDHTLFLELEAGLNHLEVYKVPCRNWDDIGECYVQLKQLADKGTLPYDTIVLDTIDRLKAVADEEVVARARERYSKMADQIYSIGDVPNGVGWSMETDLIHNALAKL